MLWSNSKKCVVSGNSSSKKFVDSQEKHPGKIAFLNKGAGYWHLLGMFFWENYEISDQRSQETRRLLQLVFTEKHFN